jgi:hypothetical protein
MASKLKRVSENTDRAITDLAEREDRTFVAQLDRVVAAGLHALGEGAMGDSIFSDKPTTTTTPKASKPAAKGTAKGRKPATATA